MRCLWYSLIQIRHLAVCPPSCRLTEAMRTEPVLARYAGGGCDLILDTTYCDSRYTFPPQARLGYTVIFVERNTSHG